MTIRTQPDGSFAVLPGKLIETGDVVAVFYDPGDPRIVPVQRLTGVPDEAADLVHGLAPPGAMVTVQVAPRSGLLAERRTVADATGRYTASFAGMLDLVPGHGGALLATLPGGDTLVGAWVSQNLVVTLGTLDTVEGLTPYPLRPASELLNEDDVPIAAGGEPVWLGWRVGGVGPGHRAGGQGYAWLAQLRDPLSADVPSQAGDGIRVALPDGNVTHRSLPRLEATVFVHEDRVAGVTQPNVAVALTLNAESPWLSRRWTAATTADNTGRFTLDLTGSFDLAYRDALQLEVREPGLVLRRAVNAPGLTLDLDSARLTGAWAPGALLAVTVASAGRELFRSRVLSDAEGAFSAPLQDAAGTPLALAAGDRLLVEAIGRPTTESVSLTVPELSAVLDPALDVVSGRASPTGELYLGVASDALPHPDRDPAAAEAAGFAPIAADGTWTFPTAPTNLAPGYAARLTYRLPVGHVVTLQRAVPLLAVEVGGTRSCGYAAAARQPISATLRSADGTPLATAAGAADNLSTFELLWRRDGAPVSALPGQLARALLGGPAAIEVPIADLSATMDWHTYVLTVQGPPNLTVGARLGALPACRALFDNPNTSFLRLDGRGFATAQFLPRPDQRVAGADLVLFAYLPDGQLLFRHLPRTTAYLYVGTDRVSGWAEAGQPVTVVQLAPDGTEIARAVAITNEAGQFETQLSGIHGPARLAAGTTVRLISAGFTEDVALAALDIDWSPGGAVVGHAEPGAAVELQLALSDGRHLSLPRSADGNGRFGFGALDVPPRADWGLGDVLAVRALVSVLGWHRLVAETPGFDTPHSRPPAIRGEHLLHLPLVARPRPQAPKP